MKRAALTTLIGLTAAAALSFYTPAGAESPGCDGFVSREDAQAHYDRLSESWTNRQHMRGMDPDNDGVVCEGYDYSRGEYTTRPEDFRTFACARWHDADNGYTVRELQQMVVEAGTGFLWGSDKDEDADGYPCEYQLGEGYRPNPKKHTPASSADAVSPAAPSASSAGKKQCVDFSTQEQAQRWYDANPAHNRELDSGGTGIACESLPTQQEQIDWITGVQIMRGYPDGFRPEEPLKRRHLAAVARNAYTYLTDWYVNRRTCQAPPLNARQQSRLEELDKSAFRNQPAVWRELPPLMRTLLLPYTGDDGWNIVDKAINAYTRNHDGGAAVSRVDMAGFVKAIREAVKASPLFVDPEEPPCAPVPEETPPAEHTPTVPTVADPPAVAPPPPAGEPPATPPEEPSSPPDAEEPPTPATPPEEPSAAAFIRLEPGACGYSYCLDASWGNLPEHWGTIYLQVHSRSTNSNHPRGQSQLVRVRIPYDKSISWHPDYWQGTKVLTCQAVTEVFNQYDDCLSLVEVVDTPVPAPSALVFQLGITQYGWWVYWNVHEAYGYIRTRLTITWLKDGEIIAGPRNWAAVYGRSGRVEHGLLPASVGADALQATMTIDGWKSGEKITKTLTYCLAGYAKDYCQPNFIR